MLYLLSIYEDKRPDDDKEEDNNKSTSALRALDDHQKFHFDYTAPAAISVQLTVEVADKGRDMYHLWRNSTFHCYVVLDGKVRAKQSV